VAKVLKTFVQTVCGEDVVYDRLTFASGTPAVIGPYAHLDGLVLEDLDISGTDPSISPSKCNCLLQWRRHTSARIGQFRRMGVNNLQRFIDYGGARS
jgi:hypothetical protein